MADQHTDSILFEQFRRGSHSALAALYHRHRPGMLRFCLKLLRDRQAAEDAVQNTFLKLQTAAAGPVKAGSVKSWMYTVARNEAFGELRRNAGNLPDEEPVWSGTLPDGLLEEQDRTAAVAAMLNALYPTYREVIVLREYDQLSYEEIAAVTGTSIASVKSRLFKARKAMLDRLSEHYPEGSL